MGTTRGFGPGRSSRNTGSGGGGGVLTLDNGLTLIGTNGQLGGPLIQPTIIDLDNNVLQIQNSIGNLNFLELDPSNPTATLVAGAMSLQMDGSNDTAILGANGAGNATVLSVNDAVQRVIVQGTGGNNFLNIDIANGLYQMGDINTFANGGELRIDDTSQQIFISTGNSSPASSFIFLDESNSNAQIGTGTSVLFIDDVLQRLSMVMNGDDYLVIDKGADIYALGDIDSISNASFLRIDDANQIAHLQAGTQHFLEMNAGSDAITLTNNISQLFISGSVFTMNNPGCSFVLDGTLKQFTVDIGSGGAAISLDDSSDNYTYGTGKNLNSRMTIDPSTETINFTNNTSSVGLTMNGVAGFTGTVTPVVSITVNNGIVTNVT